MKCPECSFENPEGFSFCGNCGTSLVELDEDTVRDLRNATPDKLKDIIKEESVRMRGERRRVIVMFADISGYTALSKERDPEELKSLINGAFLRLTDVIYKYEGYVDKIIGDCLMVLFGAPITHEDDPQRAILSALELLETIRDYGDEMGVGINLSIGIARGLCYAGEYGRPGDYTVIGSDVNLAERLQEIAPEGTIYVSSEIYKLTRNRVDYDGLGEKELRGVGSHKVYKVKGLKEYYKKKRPFVDRDEELKSLEGLLKEVTNNKGRVCFITGERGIGKTRLYEKFRSSLDADSVISGETRGIEYLSEEFYFGLVGVLRSILSIEKGSSKKTSINALNRFFKNRDDLDYAIPFIKYLLSLDMNEGERVVIESIKQEERESTIEGIISSFFLRLSEEKPLIITIEDSQYLDRASLKFFQNLTNFIEENAILLLFLSWEVISGFGDDYLNINLQPLKKKDVRTLLRLMFDNKDIGKRLFEVVFNMSKGNTLFTEEIIEGLKQEGYIVENDEVSLLTEEIDIPDRVYDVVLSRIDRIEDSSKNVLKNASVIGQEFSDILLGNILGDDVTEILDLLQEMDFIRYVEDFSVSDISGGIFTFKNEMIKEVSYELILKEDRKSLHRRAGEALEEIYRDNIDSYLERIAFHYLMAEDERAYDYLKKSADRKFDGYKLDEALVDYEKCLKIKDDFELYLKIGEIYRRKSDYDRADKYYNTAEEMVTDDEFRGRVNVKKGVLLREKGSFDEALEMLQSTEKLVEGRHKAKLYNELGIIHFSGTGKYDLALDYYRKSLEIYLDEFGEESIKVAEIYTNLGSLYFDKGDLDKGLEYMKRSLNIKRSILGDRHPQIAVNYNNMGVVYANMGNLEEALSNFKKSLDIRLSFFGENSYHAVSCYMNLGITYKNMGNYEQALRFTRKAIQVCLSIGGEENPRIVRSYLNLGLIYMDIGDYDNAMKNFNKCVKLGLSVYDGEHQDLAIVLSNIGSLYRNIGKYKKALANLNKAINLLLKIFDEKHFHIARTYKIFADVYLDTGDYETSLEYYQNAFNIIYSLFGENNPNTYRTTRDISRVYEAKGEFDKATESYEKALNISKKILDDEDDERIYLLALMSNFYRNIQDSKSSQRYFTSVKKIYNLDKNNYLNITTGMTIIPLLIDEEKYERAEEILKSSEDFFERIDNDRGVAEVYIQYSELEYNRGNIEVSKDYADRALKIAENLKVKPLLIDALTNKAFVEENNDEFVERALKICNEIGDVMRKRKVMRISGE